MLREATTNSADWGIADGYYLWPTTIKILLVIDGRIRLSKEPDNFGLGYVLDTLLSPFSWWVRFEVDIARRIDNLEGAALGDYQVKYPNFKFTDLGPGLNSYDQVWLFGDLPNDHDGADGFTTDADIPRFGLENDELKLLAEWMDRGGGVFATGDHSILGASLSSRIPRVRTMRKWTHAQGVPTRDGATSNETLQHNPPGDPEVDTLMQPVELVYLQAPGPPPFSHEVMPHPVLCATSGPIDLFPDHIHEGELFSDRRVQLDQPLDIPGYDLPEYPFVTPEPGSGPTRPRPQVIAFGRTTNNPDPQNTSSALVTSVTLQTGPKRFGLVGVYNGDPVGIGRVVVDSTWHHWLSINLHHLSQFSVPLPRYERMQAYYRNVGLWLARPAQRQSMLIAGTWGVLTGSAPMAFSLADNAWHVGERVVGVFGKTASPCIRNELAETVLNEDVRSLARKRSHKSEPDWSSLPVELTNRAVFGGIGSALLDLALDHRDKRAAGERPELDPEAIRKRAVEGIARAHALLSESTKDAATAFNAIHSRLKARALVPPIDVRIPTDVHRLCIVAETLQFPDPGDPELLGPEVTFTIRVVLNDVVACRTFDCVRMPPFGARGGIIDLGKVVIGDVNVHSRETLTIEVLAGSFKLETGDPNALRFRETLQGKPSGWNGKHVPARSQAWRLWYRIEESDRA